MGSSIFVHINFLIGYLKLSWDKSSNRVYQIYYTGIWLSIIVVLEDNNFVSYKSYIFRNIYYSSFSKDLYCEYLFVL